MHPTKRAYHPLVIYFYYAGMLGENKLAEIPYTTKKYWDTSNQTNLFGYEWVKDFDENQKDFHEISKRKIIFQAARICCRILDCFSDLYSQKKGFKTLMKKNKEIVVNTIDWLIPKLKSTEQACRIFNITSKKYNRWKGKVHCAASTLNLCFKTHPRQLSAKEVMVINDAVNDLQNLNKPKATIFYYLLRQAKLFCGITTFYKYANLICETKRFTIPEKKHPPFRASRVFEFLHIDTTFIMTEKGKRRVAFVKDNFSKVILHFAILPNGKSEYIRDLLDAAFQKFNLYSYSDSIHIVSDDGSENKGSVLSLMQHFIVKRSKTNCRKRFSVFKFHVRKYTSSF